MHGKSIGYCVCSKTGHPRCGMLCTEAKAWHGTFIPRVPNVNFGRVAWLADMKAWNTFMCSQWELQDNSENRELVVLSTG